MTDSEKLDLILSRLDNLEQKQLQAQITLENTVDEVTKINTTLENVTNRNIKIIAEGHLDLSRKLDEALRVENEKELLLIRVNVLENELKQIKEQLNKSA